MVYPTNPQPLNHQTLNPQGSKAQKSRSLSGAPSGVIGFWVEACLAGQLPLSVCRVVELSELGGGGRGSLGLFEACESAGLLLPLLLLPAAAVVVRALLAFAALFLCNFEVAGNAFCAHRALPLNSGSAGLERSGVGFGSALGDSGLSGAHVKS